MIRPVSALQVGDYVNIPIAKAKIVNSRLQVGTNTDIELPYFSDKVVGKIKPGDKLELFLGYTETGMRSELKGYVMSVSATQPLRITAIDESYKLLGAFRADNIKDKVNFRSIVSGIVPDDVVIGRIDKGYTGRSYWGYGLKTTRNFLSVWAKAFKMDFYFRNGMLYFVKPFTELENLADTEIPLFARGSNIIEDEGLKYRLAEKDAKRIKVYVVSESNGKIHKAVYPNKTIKNELWKEIYRDRLSASDCKRVAKETWLLLSYEGFVGNFTTFGWPSVEHSMPVAIWQPGLAEPKKVMVEEVIKEFSETEYKQTVKLAKYDPDR